MGLPLLRLYVRSLIRKKIYKRATVICPEERGKMQR